MSRKSWKLEKGEITATAKWRSLQTTGWKEKPTSEPSPWPTCRFRTPRRQGWGCCRRHRRREWDGAGRSRNDLKGFPAFSLTSPRKWLLLSHTIQRTPEDPPSGWIEEYRWQTERKIRAENLRLGRWLYAWEPYHLPNPDVGLPLKQQNGGPFSRRTEKSQKET